MPTSPACFGVPPKEGHTPRSNGHPLPSYTEAQATAWLAWLARGMQQHGQSVFMIELLQPTWLRTRRQTWLYALASRMLGSLFLGIACVWLWYVMRMMFYAAGEQQPAADPALRTGVALLVGLVGGLAAALLDGGQLLGRAPWIGKGRSRAVPQILLRLAVFTVIFVPILFWWHVGYVDEPLRGGLALAFLFGLVFGVFWGVRAGRRGEGSEYHDVQTVETLRWTAARAPRGCGIALGASLICSVAVMTIFAGSFYLNALDWIFVVLLATLEFGLPAAAFGAFFGGFQVRVIELKNVPNQGIRLTLRSAALSGLGACVIFGALSGLASALRHGLAAGLIDGGIGGLCAGLVAALWFGGLDVIQHYTLRALLYFKGYAPWNYARFLDYAANELGFLQKVGGGYIFIHRLLLEHFAAMAESTVSGQTAGQAAVLSTPSPAIEK